MQNDIREDIARAGNPGNIWQQRVPLADLKLGALSYQDELGALLWRIKYRGETVLGTRAVLILAKRLAGDHGRWRRAVTRPSRVYGRGAASTAVGNDNFLQRLAFRVVWEWVNDLCTACHGRGTTGPFGKTQVCVQCNGSGKMPRQHAVRARDLGVSKEQYHQVWLDVIERLLSELSVLDHEVAGGVMYQISNRACAKSDKPAIVHSSAEAI